jgi:hypothetical protein
MRVPDPQPEENGSQPTDRDGDPLRSLLPGDAVEFWGEATLLVSAVFRCREVVEGHAYEWRWLFLDDGSLVEVSPDGYFRYREHRVVKQGSSLYEELVAQDGALVRFEARVREGTSGRRPVHLALDEKQYTISSTGTFVADPLGEPPNLLPWCSLSHDPADNVYFSLYEDEQEENVVLGLWTTHVCLSFGTGFDPSDVAEVYPRGRR